MYIPLQCVDLLLLWCKEDQNIHGQQLGIVGDEKRERNQGEHGIQSAPPSSGYWLPLLCPSPQPLAPIDTERRCWQRRINQSAKGINMMCGEIPLLSALTPPFLKVSQLVCELPRGHKTVYIVFLFHTYKNNWQLVRIKFLTVKYKTLYIY